MTWSYREDLTRDLDRVRALVGDTDEDDPGITDEEILAILDLYPALNVAGAEVCRMLGAKFMRLAASSGAQSQLFEARRGMAKMYFDHALVLEFSAYTDTIRPYGGGISTSEVGAVEAQSDRVQPAFTRRKLSSTRSDPELDY